MWCIVTAVGDARRHESSFSMLFPEVRSADEDGKAGQSEMARLDMHCREHLGDEDVDHLVTSSVFDGLDRKHECSELKEGARTYARSTSKTIK